MRTTCCHFTPLLVRDMADIDLGKLDTWVEHFPLVSEISGKESEKAKLYSEHEDGLGVLLRSNRLIDGHNPTDIVYITKNDNIVLQAVFFAYLSVEFIDIDFVIESVTQFNQLICPGLLSHVLLTIIWFALCLRKVL